MQGIVGQVNRSAIVIDPLHPIPLRKIRQVSQAAVVVQSTQNIEKVSVIVEELKKRIKNLLFFNTICKPTQIKQEEIRTMPLQNDIMIIIGSKKSANTKRLYEIAKSLNPRSYWIQSKDDIKQVWLKEVKNIGITAGASTPPSTITKVIEYLKTLNRDCAFP